MNEFLNSALDKVNGLLHVPAALPQGEVAFVSHRIETLMGFKIGLVDLDRRKFLPHTGNNASNYRPLSGQNKQI